LLNRNSLQNCFGSECPYVFLRFFAGGFEWSCGPDFFLAVVVFFSFPPHHAATIVSSPVPGGDFFWRRNYQVQPGLFSWPHRFPAKPPLLFISLLYGNFAMFIPFFSEV